MCVDIDRYGEVFNRNAQSFRLQKRRPALILARKYDHLILEAPEGYGIGGRRNFYFSHMLNCVYDCRYCFLQGMYRSAHYLLFLNYEDFQVALDARLRETPDEDVYFFSGYDCDSLALESITGFVRGFLPFFATRPRAWLELRTKSTRVDELLSREPLPNVVVAFSFTPSPVSAALERGVPPLELRLRTLSELAARGWRLGLRFDPLVYTERYRDSYRDLLDTVLGRLPTDSLHSVSLGAFRMPRDFFQRIVKMYPEEPLFAGPLEEGSDGLVSYRTEIETSLRAFFTKELQERLPREIIFACGGEVAG